MKRACDPKILLLYGVFIVCCLALNIGCNPTGAVAEKKSNQLRPVKAMKLQKSPLSRSHTFPGTAKAIREVDLSFRVRGPLIYLNADTGRHVEHNSIIGKIDPRDFRVRVRTLEAQLAASEAQMEEAQLQFERHRNLIMENGVSRAEFDRAKAIYEIACAQVKANTKHLEDTRNALKDTVLRAPFSGYIHNKYVGNHETVDAGRPIVSLVDLGVMEVEIALPENRLSQVSRFKTFTCSFDALPGKQFTAAFKEIGKKPNPSNRSYPLTLTITQSDENRIRPGMAAKVSISLSADNIAGTFTVPLTAVANPQNQESYVWILDPDRNTVLRRQVSLVGLTDTGVMIRGNLHPGQWVITAGINSLTEHQSVRLLQAPSATNVGNEY